MNSMQFSLNKSLLYLYFFILTISFSPFMTSASGHNLLYIFFIIVFTLMSFYLCIDKLNLKIHLIYFLISFLISILINYSNFRLASCLFTTLLIITFSLFISMLREKKFSLNNYIVCIKCILYLYFFTLLIQQFLYLIGSSFTFNQLGTDGWKLNSLSLEPSLTGIIVSILFISYIKMNDLRINKISHFPEIISQNKLLFFIYSYIIFTCGSSFGLLFYSLILIHFFNNKYLLIYLTFIIVLIFYAYNQNFTQIVRIIDIIFAARELDVSNIFLTEASAGIRIVPVIFYFQNFIFFDINTWFGNGSAFSAKELATFLQSTDDMYYGWTLPSFLIDFGILPFFFLMFFIYKNALISIFKIEFLLFFLTLLNTSVNTQYFWISVSFFYTNVYFTKLYTK